jgi:hypothetical protein
LPAVLRDWPAEEAIEVVRCRGVVVAAFIMRRDREELDRAL